MQINPYKKIQRTIKPNRINKVKKIDKHQILTELL